MILADTINLPIRIKNNKLNKMDKNQKGSYLLNIF